MNIIKDFVAALALTTFAAGAAYATLPPPPQAAKDQAAEAAAKSAWQDKVMAYKLCLTQDQVADRYRKELKGEGKTAPAPMTLAACQDPGPFVSPMAQKPIESSGAHSPAGTASAPPSQNATAAETMGSKKPQ